MAKAGNGAVLFALMQHILNLLPALLDFRINGFLWFVALIEFINYEFYMGRGQNGDKW